MFKRNYNIISAKYKKFLLPTIILSMAMYMSIIIDGIIVGNLIGSNALGAIALLIPITGLFSTIYWTFGIGGSVLSSISKAERSEEKSRIYFSLSIASLLLIGLIIASAGFFYIEYISKILTTSAILSPLVIEYGRILFIGSPLLFIALGMSYFMRAEDKPQLATAVLLSSNIVKIIMDIVYIKFFNLGIGGAALATVTGYLIGSLFVVKYLISKDRETQFINILKFKIKNLKEIIFSGFPPASGQLFILIKTFTINTIILSSIGTPGTVAFAICFDCLIIASIPVMGASQTMSPIVSVFYSERDFNGVKFIMKKSFKIVVVSCFLLTLFILLFPSNIMEMFGVSSGNNLIVGEYALRIFSLSFVGTAITFLMLFYTQAIQKKFVSFLISISQGLIILIPSAYILSNLIGGFGIWISFSIAEIGTIIIIYITTVIISKKSNGNYSGILMLPKNKNSYRLDVTIEDSINDAVGLSEQLIDFVEENGIDKKIAVHVGIAVEEMVVNTIKYNSENIDFIDVLSEIDEHEIRISFKDSGIEYDPTKQGENEGNKFDNIYVLKKIADKISYARLIGLNSTIITIKR
jgi:Na+-driven multidrug efflux pump/anti-sigma regulatory factor (Ser/Thr protein kinase)